MKPVSYNTRFGLDTDHEIDLERTADMVRAADIIGPQEVERNWKCSGMVDQPQVLGELLTGYYWSYCNAFDMDAGVLNDDGAVLNRRRQFGPMVQSRWPMLHARPMVFPKLGTMTTFNMDTGGIECVIDTHNGPRRVYSIHLSTAPVRDRLLQLDYLLAWHRLAQPNGRPCRGGTR
jgi:endonuclease/exonuclease/phosphatase family metal-dependent hydrolase